MLIRFFRRSYLIHYVTLTILSLLLFIPAIIGNHPAAVTKIDMVAPAWGLLLELTNNHSMLLVILQIVIFFLGAIFLNVTLEKYDLTPNNSLTPAFIMIVFGSHYSGLSIPNPVIISSIFLIAVLYLLFSIYLEVDAFGKIFYSGFLIAIASFFYFPLVFFMAFVFLTFVIYRLNKWRDWVIALMGFFTPYLFYFMYAFWFDKLPGTLIKYSHFFSHLFILQSPVSFTISEYIIFAGMLFFFLPAAFKLTATINDNLITVRKRYWSVFWFVIVSIFVFIISWFEGMYYPEFLLIGIAIVITYYLSSLKRLFWFEIVMSFITLLILANNYYSLLFREV